MNDMEDQDEIIVFRRFENSFMANVAKTKLDAYGVPCFLTDENLANLYPFQNFLAMGVRLHLFAKDVDWAKSVLTENNLSIND
jgi:hypothetical protein